MWKMHLSALFSMTKLTNTELGPAPAAASDTFLIWFSLSQEHTEGTAL